MKPHEPTAEVVAEEAQEAVEDHGGQPHFAPEDYDPDSAWNLELAKAGGDVKATTKPTESTTEAREDQSGLELGSVGEGLCDVGDGDNDNDNDEEEQVAMTDEADTSPEDGSSTGNNNHDDATASLAGRQRARRGADHRRQGRGRGPPPPFPPGADMVPLTKTALDKSP